MIIAVPIVAGAVILKAVILRMTTTAAAFFTENATGGDDHGDEAEQVENDFHAATLPRIEGGGYGCYPTEEFGSSVEAAPRWIRPQAESYPETSPARATPATRPTGRGQRL